MHKAFLFSIPQHAWCLQYLRYSLLYIFSPILCPRYKERRARKIVSVHWHCCISLRCLPVFVSLLVHKLWSNLLSGSYSCEVCRTWIETLSWCVRLLFWLDCYVSIHFNHYHQHIIHVDLTLILSVVPLWNQLFINFSGLYYTFV